MCDREEGSRCGAPNPGDRPGRPGVAEFFAGRCVLVTGATGFVGKVLVERLVRCCPDIAAVYLLLRPRRGLAAHERLQQLTQGQVSDGGGGGGGGGGLTAMFPSRHIPSALPQPLSTSVGSGNPV
ncbi:fatty acyl-CoA reductase 1-like [Schistocerca gregaria]|uniref:fatty acyl-CoA reductase 1-like n=1 Tax=Schistocerca gregaria TaxID=7010 RepID=UPI00211DABB4|nr:fatty acyl-CoA reductase 1-like [Schistocerca gregaria]